MSNGYAQVLEQQRRAFESEFGSLESMGFEDKTKYPIDESSDGENTSDQSFHGFSDAGDENDENDDYDQSTSPVPKVIRFRDPGDTYEPPSREDKKQLRSGKSLGKIGTPIEHLEFDLKCDSDVERQNIRNDVELQKFLHESHLLNALDSSSGESTGQIHGKARARTLELNLQLLSTTNGCIPRKLEKLPMQVRKGMLQKHLHRIHTHEQEAKDAGIVLSKTKKGQFRRIESTYKNDIERRIGTSIKSREKQRRTHRQRGLKVQSIGKSSRHGLKISAKDIDRISKS